MSRGTNPEDERRVVDALSYIWSKTMEIVSEEAGVPKPVVRRIVARMIDSGHIEKRGHYYRYDCANPWKNAMRAHGKSKGEDIERGEAGTGPTTSSDSDHERKNEGSTEGS